jgi:hypothetical protein
MELAKGLIPPTDMPSLPIELHLDYIFSVLSIVLGVHIDPCLLNDHVKREAEEVGPLHLHLMIALLVVLKELL